jgi:hypothetical protein
MRDTIDMAREVFDIRKDHRGRETFSSDSYGLEDFAALVRADEREECAKVCETGVDYEHPTVKGHIMENFGHSRLLAKAIRARGNT